nr:hypothetical protein CFP56_08034 [Quercus suber]
MSADQEGTSGPRLPFGGTLNDSVMLAAARMQTCCCADACRAVLLQARRPSCDCLLSTFGTEMGPWPSSRPKTCSGLVRVIDTASSDDQDARGRGMGDNVSTNGLSPIGAGEDGTCTWIGLYLVGNEDGEVEFFRHSRQDVKVLAQFLLPFAKLTAPLRSVLVLAVIRSDVDDVFAGCLSIDVEAVTDFDDTLRTISALGVYGRDLVQDRAAQHPLTSQGKLTDVSNSSRRASALFFWQLGHDTEGMGKLCLAATVLAKDLADTGRLETAIKNSIQLLAASLKTETASTKLQKLGRGLEPSRVRLVQMSANSVIRADQAVGVIPCTC